MTNTRSSDQILQAGTTKPSLPPETNLQSEKRYSKVWDTISYKEQKETLLFRTAKVDAPFIDIVLRRAQHVRFRTLALNRRISPLRSDDSLPVQSSPPTAVDEERTFPYVAVFFISGIFQSFHSRVFLQRKANSRTQGDMFSILIISYPACGFVGVCKMSKFQSLQTKGIRVIHFLSLRQFYLLR